MSKLTRTNAILPFIPTRDLTGLEGRFVFIKEDATVDHYHYYYYGSYAIHRPFGVLILAENTESKVSVALSEGGLSGTIKLKLNGAVSAGDILQLANNGTVETDSEAGDRWLVGQALESGVADEMIEAVLFRPEFIAGV